MNYIEFYRPDQTAIPYVKTYIDDSCTQVKKVMGENIINVTFEDSRYIQFKINDYCTVFNEVYHLNKLPGVVKLSTFKYRYSLVMEADYYDLSKYQYLFLGGDNSLRESDFSLMGDANTFIDLVIANANRVSSGWTKGQVIVTGYKNITFTKENCYSVLSIIAEKFDTEFSIEGKTIHLTKRANDTGYTFMHGRGNGLYEITRQNLSDSGLVTRLYAFGSEKNLPPDYRNYSPRLTFPAGYNPCLIANLTATVAVIGPIKRHTISFTPPLSQGVQALTVKYRAVGSSDNWTSVTAGWTSPRVIDTIIGNFEFKFQTIGTGCIGDATTEVVDISNDIITPVLVYPPMPYIERNVPIYGVIEHTQIFEDIYPHRTGTVSSINLLDPFEFTDTGMDFDLNSQLLPGAVAKVTFNTGQLSGYTFEIQSFNYSTKKFRIQLNTDEKKLEIPNALIKPGIGDKYVLTDIIMPPSYIAAAEQELLDAANALLVQLSEPQLSYTIQIDPVYLKEKNKLITIADLIWIVDDQLEVQKKIRVISATRNLMDEYSLTVEVSDIVSPGTINRIINAQTSTERDVMDMNGQFINNGILNNRVAGTLTFENMPETNTGTGFKQVYIEESTGKLYKLI